MKSHRDLALRLIAVFLWLFVGLSGGDTPFRAPVSARAAPPAPPAAGPKARLCAHVVAGGRSVPGAALRLFHELEARRFTPSGEATTDTQGRACLPLAHGVVRLLAEAPGHARASTVVLLDRDREVTIELPEARKLAVEVVDELGAALARATVLVTASDPLPYGALTDARGSARFDRLPPLPWTVRASMSGYEGTTRSGVDADLRVVLRRLAALDVRVVDGKEAPVPGAQVLIAGATLWPARRAECDAQGIARIRGLEAGSYDLLARHGTLVSPALAGFLLARGARESVTLRVEPGRMVTAIVTDGEGTNPYVVPDADVVLAEGGVSSFPLRGRTRGDGKVTLGPIASGPATLQASAADFVGGPLVVVPDVLDGPVRVPLLKGGTLRGEVVDARGYAIDGASVEVVGNDRYGLPIAESPQALGFRASHFAWALSGPVALIPAGELGVMPGPVPPIPPPGAPIPLAGAAVAAVEPVTPLAPWVTDAGGEFVARPVTPGRVRALVRHPEYVEGASEMVALAPGGEAKVRVVLLKGGGLEGRVVDERGYPVSGVFVEVFAEQGTFERETITAGDGAFAFAAVPSDVVVTAARADDPGRAAVRKVVEVPEGGRATIELVLPAPRDAVRIVVRDESEEPVELAEVRVASLDVGAPLRKTLFTDGTGSVELADARGLPLQIVVDAPRFAPVQREVDAAPEQIVIDLDAGVLVEGRVTSVRGRAYVSGAFVTLRSGTSKKTATTNAEGLYRFSGAPPGPATLGVSHPDFASATSRIEIRRTGRADRAFEIEAIDLNEPGEVEGQVVDRDGRGVDGARVALDVAPAYLPAGALPEGMALSDAGGNFTLRGVPSGKLRIAAYAPGVGRGSVEGVEVDAGRTSRGVVIRLTEPTEADEPTASGGVAITLGERGDGDSRQIVVAHVAPASEAERAGILAGDVIERIDGQVPSGMADARSRLAGRAGSDVVLDLLRAGASSRLRATREPVRR